MTAKRLTLRYVATYITAFAIISWLFNFIPSEVVEALTAQTSALALSLAGHTVDWAQSGGITTLTLFGQDTVTVSIIRECTALNVLGVMAGLILPLKANWTKRLKGISLAGLLLFILNIPRIALTVYLTAYDTWPFTLIAERTLETFHYPISFAFGIIGTAITVLAVSRWATPELSETLLGIMDGFAGPVKKGETEPYRGNEADINSEK
jgi:exosortase/archaeosortase family protein